MPSSNIGAIAAYAKRYHVWVLAIASAAPGFHALVDSTAVFPEQRTFLAIVTPLACAAMVGYCLYLRDIFVKVVHIDKKTVTIVIPFLARIAPGGLLIVSFSFGALYLYLSAQSFLNDSYGAAGESPVALMSRSYALGLIGSYIGFFATLEAAFTILITKEYLQDELKIMDTQLVLRRERARVRSDNTP